MMTIADFQTYVRSINLMVYKLRQSQPGDLAPIINSLCSDLLCLSGRLSLLDLVKDVKDMSESKLLTMLTDLEAEGRSATTRTGRDCAAYLLSVCEAECNRRGIK